MSSARTNSSSIVFLNFSITPISGAIDFLQALDSSQQECGTKYAEGST